MGGGGGESNIMTLFLFCSSSDVFFICLAVGGCVGGWERQESGFRFRQVGGNLGVVEYWRLRLGQ